MGLPLGAFAAFIVLWFALGGGGGCNSVWTPLPPPLPARWSDGVATSRGRRRRRPPWTAPPARPRRSRRATCHSCAIQAGTGAVVCWGDNYYGQATPPPSVNGTAGTASAIAAGGGHSCAIQAGTGAVVCWGGNYFGQATPPPSVDGTAGTASAIAAGDATAARSRPAPARSSAGAGNVYGQATPPPSVDGTAGTASAIAAGGVPQLRDPGRHRRGRLLGRTTPRAGDAASLRGRHRRHRLGDRGGLATTAARSRPAPARSSAGATTSTAGDAASLRGRHRRHRLGDRGGRLPQLRDPGRHRRGRLLGRQRSGQATPPPSVDGTAGTASAIAAGDGSTLSRSASIPPAPTGSTTTATASPSGLP